ncbi:MAG: hypothetical protein OXU45_03410 [Candidatus Melainabacteria bacterium]|nr:hypothetical protein [Candidatus Melainabacteria bacterium]
MTIRLDQLMTNARANLTERARRLDDKIARLQEDLERVEEQSLEFNPYSKLEQASRRLASKLARADIAAPRSIESKVFGKLIPVDELVRILKTAEPNSRELNLTINYLGNLVQSLTLMAYDLSTCDEQAIELEPGYKLELKKHPDFLYGPNIYFETPAGKIEILHSNAEVWTRAPASINLVLGPQEILSLDIDEAKHMGYPNAAFGIALDYEKISENELESPIHTGADYATDYPFDLDQFRLPEEMVPDW